MFDPVGVGAQQAVEVRQRGCAVPLAWGGPEGERVFAAGEAAITRREGERGGAGR